MTSSDSQVTDFAGENFIIVKIIKFAERYPNVNLEDEGGDLSFIFKILYFTTSAMLLTGLPSCVKQEDQMLSNLRSPPPTGPKPDALDGEAIAATGKKDGSATGTFRSGSAKNSIMMAAKGTDLEGAGVMVPAGALAEDLEIALMVGPSLSDPSIYQALKIDAGTVMASGVSVAFVPTKTTVAIAAPIQIQLPIPQLEAAALLEGDSSTLVVMFHTLNVARQLGRIGAMPLSAVALTNKTAQFMAEEFGVFQIVRLSAPILEKVSIDVSYMPSVERISYSADEKSEVIVNSTTPIREGAVVGALRPTAFTFGSGAKSYKSGSTVSIKIKFSKAATVSGTPQLLLETGTTDRLAKYIGGTGTQDLTFNYVVQGGDSALKLDYKDSDAFQLNGGSIKDSSGKPADLYLPPPGTEGSMSFNPAMIARIDTEAPAFSTATLAEPAYDGFLGAAEVALGVDLVTSVTGTGYDKIGYRIASAAALCSSNLIYSADMPKTNAAEFTANGDYKVCIRLTDDAVNAPAYGSTSQFSVTLTGPVFRSAALGSLVSDGFLNATEHAGLSDLALNVDGSNYDVATFALANSTAACDASLTYLDTIKANHSTLQDAITYKICVRLEDSAGNAPVYGATATFTTDFGAPTFTSVALAIIAADGFVNYVDSLTASDLLSAPVGTGFDSSSYALVASVTTCNSSISYGAMPKSNAGNFATSGNFKVCVKLSDLAGNTAAYGGSSVFKGDIVRPTVTSISTTSSGSNKAGATIAIKANFSEPVLIVGNPQLTLETGTTDRTVTANTVNVLTSQLSFSYVVQADENSGDLDYASTDALTLNGATIRDDSGNDAIITLAQPGQSGSLAAGAAIVIDTLAPTFTSVALANDAADGYLNNTEILANVAISSVPVGDFNTAEYVVVSYSTSCSTATGYSAAIPLAGNAGFTGNGDFKVCVKLSDTAGNTPAYGASVKLVRDNAAPAHNSTIRELSVQNDLSVKLFWNAASDGVSKVNAIKYRICRSTSASGCTTTFTTFATTAPGVFEYHDTTVPTTGIYYYLVRAVDESGNVSTGTAQVKRDLLTGASDIFVGQSHACMSAGNSGKCWGENSLGQLGEGTSVDRLAPVSLQSSVFTGGLSITKMALGATHTCALMSNGAVRCWGDNAGGQVGPSGNSSGNLSPYEVLSSGTASDIAAGGQYTCAVLTAGGVKCWGDNSHGQLGDNSVTSRTSPTSVLDESASGPLGGVSKIATHMGITNTTAHTCALMTDSTVRCWGKNANGQLGNGTTTDSNVPVVVSGINTAVEVTVGFIHSCARLADSTVKCWGSTYYNQIGSYGPAINSSPIAVSGVSDAVDLITRRNSNCVKLGAGGYKCWGDNADGVFGDYSATTPTGPSVFANLAQFSKVELGLISACGIAASGNVRCWGSNASGQLGNGLNAFRITPQVMPRSNVVQIASSGGTMCALKSDESVTCWGSNGSGVLGDGTTNNSLAGVTPFAAGSGVTQIAVSQSNACALKSNGTVFCWGGDNSGQLGNGAGSSSPTPIQINMPSPRTATKIDLSSSEFSCALLDDDTVSCWGQNGSGQLGQGGTTSLDSPSAPFLSDVVDIGLGYEFACALRGNGTVYCWGRNNGLQAWPVGSTITNVLSPTAVPGVSTAVSLSVGGTHACVITQSSSIQCWGANSSGQLGNNGSSSPTSAVTVAVGGTYLEVSAGSTHTCARRDTGDFLCWGLNTSYQLGDLTITQRGAPTVISAIRSVSKVSLSPNTNHSCITYGTASNSGEVLCWGDAGGYSLFGAQNYLGISSWTNIP